MTIGPADADRAGARPGARPYLRQPAERLGPIISRVAQSETKPSGQSFFRTHLGQECLLSE